MKKRKKAPPKAAPRSPVPSRPSRPHEDKRRPARSVEKREVEQEAGEEE